MMQKERTFFTVRSPFGTVRFVLALWLQTIKQENLARFTASEVMRVKTVN